MKIINHTIHVNTTKENEFVDITAKIRTLLNEASIQSGSIHLFVPHTTAAITLNENTDPDVRQDMIYGLNQTFPNDQAYQHYEGNSHAHIKSSVIGVDQMIIVEKGNMMLGRWQAIYFCEFDGPRHRTLVVQIVGE